MENFKGRLQECVGVEGRPLSGIFFSQIVLLMLQIKLPIFNYSLTFISTQYL